MNVGDTSISAAMRSHAVGGAPAHEPPRTPDQQFVWMLDAFRGTGGLARTAEVLAQLQSRHGLAREVLARWIDQRRAICFKWQTLDWIPWFQFSRHSMAPYRQLQPVLAELNAVYDPWELANWFATPNPWLAEQLPGAALRSDLPAVLRAAQADRFIANG